MADQPASTAAATTTSTAAAAAGGAAPAAGGAAAGTTTTTTTTAPAGNAAPLLGGAATPAAGTTTTETPEQKAAAAAAAAAAANKPPEKYEFTKPKDFAGNDQDLARVGEVAKALGLSQEQANKLLDQDHAAIKGQIEDAKREAAQQRNDWVAAIKSDKEVGGEKFDASLTAGNAALARFDTDGSLARELAQSGLDAHPGLFRVFARIGLAMSEPQKFVTGTQPDPKTAPLHDRLYDPKTGLARQ